MFQFAIISVLIFIACQLINGIGNKIEEIDLKKALEMHLLFVGAIMILCHILRDMLPTWKFVIHNWSLTNLSSKLKEYFEGYQEESNESDGNDITENSKSPNVAINLF